jgi:hypothetical protein
MKLKGKNLINKIWDYAGTIIKDSSKRLAFLYCVLIILTPLVFIHTNKENFELVLAELLAFMSFLAGGGIYESINKKDGKTQ